MVANKSRGTRPELLFGKLLWNAGVRYRKNDQGVKGTPDFSVRKYRAAIFCDGEFFHGKDYDKKKPVDHNHAYWDAKIRRNMERDLEVTRQLRSMGWVVLRFWNRDVLKNLDKCLAAVQETVFEQKISAGE